MFTFNHQPTVSRRYLIIAFGVCCLTFSLVSLSPGNLEAATGSHPHQSEAGIINFHGLVHPMEKLAGLHNPSVVGGELILFWSQLEPREKQYRWDILDEYLAAWQSAGKKLDLRIATVHESPNDTPAWLYEDYGVRRVARGAWVSFESSLEGYELLTDGVVTDQPELVISRSKSLYGQSSVGNTAVLLEYGRQTHLDPDSSYAVQFDFHLHQPGQYELVHTAVVDGTTRETVYPFGLNQTRGTFSQQIELGSEWNHTIRWQIRDSGSVSIDNIQILKILDQPQFHRSVFGGEPNYWQPSEEARLESDPSLVLSGSHSLRLANRSAGFVTAFRNDPQRLPIEQGRGYAVNFKYKALQDSTLVYRIIRPGTEPVEIDSHLQHVAAGQGGVMQCYTAALLWLPDCVLEVGLEGPGEVILDDIVHTVWSDRVPCFPNYFDPQFRAKWQQMLQALADRYGDHPALGCLSVAGFGRWGEVMLDENVPGLLDDQWITWGFTENRYLEHLVWSMDLYQRLFPSHPLRICLAYGLHHQNDMSWIYRRAAQAAACRGIGLKQNGMTENYDIWGEETDPSYLFRRYQYDPNLSLTHETAGQIFVNSFGCTGHTVSLLNRAMINGIDYLFMYPPDITGRHVNKYFHQATEQMGRAVWGQFYNYLGDYSVVHDNSPARVFNANLWRGIRQHEHPQAITDYLTVAGERCASTTGTDGRIFFDFDDRSQYHGMYGATINVTYLDGTENFAIGAHNHSTDGWEVLSHFAPKGTGQWVTYSTHRPDLFRSSRNHGKDVQVDLAVHHLTGQGQTVVREVTVDFVPADSWTRNPFWQAPPVGQHAQLEETLTREIDFPAPAPIAAVRIPLWTNSLPTNGLYGRVWTDINGEDVLLAEKEFWMPDNGDWFELPLDPIRMTNNLRIELDRPTGVIGCYLDENNEMALDLLTYALKPGQPQDVYLPTDEGNPGAIVAATTCFDWPFAGVRISSTHALGDLQLERRLFDGKWTTTVTACRGVRTRQGAKFLFEPQLPGVYRLTTNSQTLMSGENDSPISIVPLELQRRLPARPATRLLSANPDRDQLVWGVGAEHALAKWQATGYRTQQFDDNGAIRFAVDAPRILQLEWQPETAIEAKPHQQFVFSIRNQTAASMARLFWRTEQADYCPENSVLIPIISYDTEVRDYLYPVGLEANWQGTISGVRFQPVTGSMAQGKIDLAMVGFQASSVLAEWEFEDPSSLVETVKYTRIQSATAGALLLKVDGREEDWPTIRFPDHSFEIQAESDQLLEIRMRNHTSGNQARLKWRAKTEPRLGIWETIYQDTDLSLAFPISAHDEEFQTYRIPLGNTPRWQGHLHVLALNPVENSAEGGLVEIDSVRIIAPSPGW